MPFRSRLNATPAHRVVVATIGLFACGACENRTFVHLLPDTPAQGPAAPGPTTTIPGAAIDSGPNTAPPPPALSPEAGTSPSDNGSAAPDVDSSFPDFATTTGLNLIGNAVGMNNAVEMLPQNNQGRGGVYLNDPLEWSFNSRLAAEFSFTVVSDGSSSADGIVFVMHNDPRGTGALGFWGGKIGYGGSGGIKPSIGVEFDIHENETDPNDNHVAILTDGDEITHVALTETLPLRLGDGAKIFAWVDYSESTEALSLYISEDDQKPQDSILSHRFSLSETVGDTVYVGLVAASGKVISRMVLESMRVRKYTER